MRLLSPSRAARPASRGGTAPVPRLAACLAVVVALASGVPAMAQKFGQNKVTYDKFDWHVYKAPHFDVYYYPEEEAFLEQVVSYAESAYVTISKALEHEIRFRIPLIYYKTHREFEQTNILLSFIDEGVGAFAEPVEKRMVLPIDLPPSELYELIAHELTHIFEYSILYQDTLGREVRANPPGWLMEGLASFMAHDEGALDLMIIRDAVVNGVLPTLEQLRIPYFIVYRYGHAIFDFITQEFGKEGVRNFLLEFRKVLLTHNVEKAIKEAFGWELEEFERRFHKYLRQKYLPILLEKDEPADYGQEIVFKADKERGRQFWTLSPAIAPSGELIVAITTRYDDLDVAIFSAKDGQVVRNLTKGYTTDYESITVEFFKEKRDLAWSQDGDRVAFFARKGRRQPLFIYHAVTGEKLDEIPIDIDRLASPAFTPDGKEVAFSGNLGGVVDIFAIDLKTRQVHNLTQDEFHDSNPSWSADGKRILYNRRLESYEKIFMVESADPTRKTQLTFGNTRDIQPSFSADGKFVYYASDYGGQQIYNIYSLDLADGTVRRYTDVLGGNFTPVELTVDTGGRRTLAFASYAKSRFQLYKMVLGEPLQIFRPGQPPDPPEPRKLRAPSDATPTRAADDPPAEPAGGVASASRAEPAADPTPAAVDGAAPAASGTDAEADAPAGSLPPQVGAQSVADGRDWRRAVRRWKLFARRTGEGSEGALASQLDANPAPAAGEWDSSSDESGWEGGTAGPGVRPARPTRSLGATWTAVALAPTPGAPSATAPEIETFEPPLKLKIDESEKSRYTKRKWSIEGQPSILFGVADDGTLISDSVIVFSDLLGDYRHFLRLQSVSSFTDVDYAFLNLKNRADWVVRAFDQRDYFVVGRTSGGTDRRQQRRTTGALVSWQYPFSLYHRIDTSVGYFDRTLDFPVLVDTGGFLEIEFIRNKEHYPLLGGSFTGDTTRFRYFGPYHGRRYEFSYRYAPTVSGETTGLGGETRDATSFFNYYIDYRNYWSWSRRSLFALRAYSAVSNGSGSDIFSFGGFNTLRGFDFREFFGTRIAFLNMELRFPLIDELRFPFGSIRQIRGVLFMDIGAAWFSGGEACDLLTDPDPGTGGTEAECGIFEGISTDAGTLRFANRRVFDNDLGEFREFDFWDSNRKQLKDGRASVGVGLSFYFGPFELNWVFSEILPHTAVDPFTGVGHRENPGGYRSAFYIGRKF